MINHLCINRPDENGCSQSAKADPSSGRQTTHLIANNRELYKDFGSPWEIVGYLLEHLISMPEELTVELIISGSGPAMKLLNDCLGNLHLVNNFLRPMPPLTPLEFKTLDLLNEGMSEKEIAEDGSVDEQTVRNRCCGMHKKFNCRTNGQMIAAARRLRLVN